MFSKKHRDHYVCDNDQCRATFPEAWITTRKAVRAGNLFFCSPYCHEEYEEEERTLPFASTSPKAINGAAVIKRIH